MIHPYGICCGRHGTSDRELTQTEDVLAKGLNFAGTPEGLPVVDLITANETTITNNNLPEAETTD